MNIIRRILSTAAAVAILSLASAGAASAQFEAGSGPQTVSREGYVSDESLASLRTGLGALFGLALAGTAVVALRRHASHPASSVSGSGGGSSRELGDLNSTPRAGLA